MQHYTIFFIAVNALHVSDDFSAHHQLKTVHTASGTCQAWHVPDAVCTVFSWWWVEKSSETCRAL